MKLKQLLEHATDISRFSSLGSYQDFCRNYLEFIEKPSNTQAKIIAQNEHQYYFYQYNKAGNYQITRPINEALFYTLEEFEKNLDLFNQTTINGNAITASPEIRTCINSMLYTMQQCVGSSLDGLPVGLSNKARKINGTLFEKLILLYLDSLGIVAKAETLELPVVHNNQVLFKMKYQHDLVIRNSSGDVKVIGAIKTTSKDRIDKVFIDKLLYSKLSYTDIKHIAIVLNDVQRKKTNRPDQFGIGSTFLPGRFKGYMIKLCPLEGVYYLDIRKAMQTDKVLQQMIQTFDKLVFDDLVSFIQ
jgi:hypothetical protein